MSDQTIDPTGDPVNSTLKLDSPSSAPPRLVLPGSDPLQQARSTISDFADALPGAAHASGYGNAANHSIYESEGRHLTDYVRILYKRRWTAISTFAVILGSMTVYT